MDLNSISKAQTFERDLQILSHFSSVRIHEILVAGILRERERLYEKRERFIEMKQKSWQLGKS